MKLYKVDAKGNLNRINKFDFLDNDVYLVDDDKTIYIWVGKTVSQAMKDTMANIARQLDKERGGAAKILIMKQGREYGSFLAIINQLKKGLENDEVIEKRPELELEEPDLVKWLNQLKQYRKPAPELKYVVFKEGYPDTKKEEVEFTVGLEGQIKVAAYYLSVEGYNYNDLCWLLAERIMKQSLRLASIEDIRLKSEEVYESSSTYEEICWLIAELDILKKFKFFEIGNEQLEFNL